VPYPPERRPGSINIGFQALKGASEASIASIPEVRDSVALREALISVNAIQTDFFTVGCEKSMNRDGNKFWKKGYLEFSYNYAEAVSDAMYYFALFFHFQKLEEVRKLVGSTRVQFVWELQPAQFTKIERDGFTCAVWITTGTFDQSSECERVWDDAVHLLTQFLVAGRIKQTTAMTGIYEA
jgi:hypothetical protein